MSASPISVIVAFYGNFVAAAVMLTRLRDPIDGRMADVADVGLMAVDRGNKRLRFAARSETKTEHYCRERFPAGTLDALFPPAILDVDSRGSSACAAESHFDEHGFSTNLLKEIGENMPPDGAALVVVVEEPAIGELERTISGYEHVVRYPAEAAAS